MCERDYEFRCMLVECGFKSVCGFLLRRESEGGAAAPPEEAPPREKRRTAQFAGLDRFGIGVVMILPQVHLRKPCYDFTFL